MPIDIGVLQKLDKGSIDPATLKSTGNTNYTWAAYEGDFQLHALKDFITVDGTTKLAQGIFKIVLTPLGSNTEDPLYGTDLPTIIGGKLDSAVFAQTTSSVIDALTYYNLINQDNPNSDEVIRTIDLVRVVNDLNDPRAVMIQISVTSESGKVVAVQVPQIM